MHACTRSAALSSASSSSESLSGSPISYNWRPWTLDDALHRMTRIVGNIDQIVASRVYQPLEDVKATVESRKHHQGVAVRSRWLVVGIDVVQAHELFHGANRPLLDGCHDRLPIFSPLSECCGCAFIVNTMVPAMVEQVEQMVWVTTLTGPVAMGVQLQSSTNSTYKIHERIRTGMSFGSAFAASSDLSAPSAWQRRAADSGVSPLWVSNILTSFGPRVSCCKNFSTASAWSPRTDSIRAITRPGSFSSSSEPGRNHTKHLYFVSG